VRETGFAGVRDAAASRCVLLVNCLDGKGGASGIAVDLFRGIREAGHTPWLGVSRKTLQDPNVLQMDDPPWLAAWEKACRSLAERLERGGRLSPMATAAARFFRRHAPHPLRSLLENAGLELFNYPGARTLIERLPTPPDIIHCHNLHHAYFDLGLLPAWSRRHPLVLTLHDAWLLAGHCVHGFDCERWRTGCGACPGLSIYPPLKRDATSWNFRRKRRIYSRSRLYVTTPSRWLMDKVEHSMLAGGMRLGRVIPNGVDTATFRPGNAAEERRRLGLDPEAYVVLFVAEDPRENEWKDYDTLRRAFARLEGLLRRKTILLAVGGGGEATELEGRARILPFVKDQALLAGYYRAADVYAHAAKAETFPTVILEAMACGTAVAATAVGGIPEQVRDGSTGLLAPAGDDEALAGCLAKLGTDAAQCRSMGEEAASIALHEYSRARMRSDYSAWYEEIIEDFRSRRC
jgi:glycosyltransferase involved in cell wall biosynthesis